MRIGIVIPVFNEEAIISATLAGLKRLKPDEVIVVDGGSTDRTREIAQSLGVTLIYSSRSRGRQMNHGARSSKCGLLNCFTSWECLLPSSADTIATHGNVLTEKRLYTLHKGEDGVGSNRFCV